MSLSEQRKLEWFEQAAANIAHDFALNYMDFEEAVEQFKSVLVEAASECSV